MGKLVYQLSRTRFRRVGQIPPKFKVEKIMPVTTRITADGAFLLGCEDNPAALVSSPSTTLRKGARSILGIARPIGSVAI